MSDRARVTDQIGELLRLPAGQERKAVLARIETTLMAAIGGEISDSPRAAVSIPRTRSSMLASLSR